MPPSTRGNGQGLVDPHSRRVSVRAEITLRIVLGIWLAHTHSLWNYISTFCSSTRESQAQNFHRPLPVDICAASGIMALVAGRFVRHRCRHGILDICDVFIRNPGLVYNIRHYFRPSHRFSCAWHMMGKKRDEVAVHVSMTRYARCYY